jgi:hypothetical protein
VVKRDIAILRSLQFTPDKHVLVRAEGGVTLYVFHSVCTGSADGHCQAIHVFRGGERSPVWHRDYVDVLGMQPAPDGFVVRAADYSPGDPLCCPSGGPVTDTYRWTEHGFRESGRLPRAPGS